MSEATATATDSREIRVFLSSTFRDFMQERDLLVKQVFPALRRRAQERGVEVVDVDLRWGITEEESQQGKVIGICLAEIERCRPYFIGMLGERYGWTPQPGDYPDELFEREQLQWIRDHQGNASVTELEILHGVLNNQEMAGRAFFYFRDPAWSRAQSESGFVCDTEEEKQKLADLKERIRSSGFPVAEHLADPQAIADRIEADLWALIEELYPDLDQADALEREARKHAGYRQSRLGVYLGGEGYIQQLEEWIQAGERKILVTGESGAGKSALIANWLAVHERTHPGDVVHAHHLGCSNDANAIRPLLARMLDTASRLLQEHELIFEPIQVPQDWWELTAKVAGTLQDLGRWCRNTGNRWIWVLDGLDRLDEDDQQALPWLPLLIPEGVSVVISALECPARTILEERQFRTLTIGPLQRPEQEALIERYLERYTKKLEPERRQQILSCELARSPLFLRVLLEELRQCGRFETLKEQIEAYIRPRADGSLAVDDLYERVLERLEGDCGMEVIRKVMTALWASRAGLSESELLGITELAPLQWAPVDLALEQALGRNGNRLVFGHAYLRKAVQKRYLISYELEISTHKRIANSLIESGDWMDGAASTVLFSLAMAGLHRQAMSLVFGRGSATRLLREVGPAEFLSYLALNANPEEVNGVINELLDHISELTQGGGVGICDQDDKLDYWASLGDLALQAGRPHPASIQCFEICLQIIDPKARDGLAQSCVAHLKLAESFLLSADYQKAEASIENFLGLIDACSDSLGSLYSANHYGFSGVADKASGLSLLGIVYGESLRFKEAREALELALNESIRRYGEEHPTTLSYKNNLLMAISDEQDSGDRKKSLSKDLEELYVTRVRVLGKDHMHTLVSLNNLSLELWFAGSHERAAELMEECIDRRIQLYGSKHQHVLDGLNNLATMKQFLGDVQSAIRLRSAEKELFKQSMPSPSRHLIQSVCELANCHVLIGDFGEAKSLSQDIVIGLKTLSALDANMANKISAWWQRGLHNLIDKLCRNEAEGFDGKSVIDGIILALRDALPGV